MQEFGTFNKTSDELSKDLLRLVGENFPFRMSMSNGKLTYFSFDTTWREGGTKPQITKNSAGEEVTEYVEDFKNRSLTKKQVELVRKWADENVVTA